MISTILYLIVFTATIFSAGLTGFIGYCFYQHRFGRASFWMNRLGASVLIIFTAVVLIKVCV